MDTFTLDTLNFTLDTFTLVYTTSVALIPLRQVSIKEREAHFGGKLYRIRLTSCEALAILHLSGAGKHGLNLVSQAIAKGLACENRMGPQ